MYYAGTSLHCAEFLVGVLHEYSSGSSFLKKGCRLGGFSTLRCALFVKPNMALEFGKTQRVKQNNAVLVPGFELTI